MHARGEPRFNPMSGTWPMVLFDLLVVVGLASAARGLAELPGSSWLAWGVFVLVTSVLVMVFVAVPLRVLLLDQRTQSERVTSALTAQNEMP